MNFARSFQLLIPNLRLGGRYQVVRRLGVGGFSETFLAKDTQLPGKPYCVIKQLKPQSRNLKGWQVAKRLFDAEAEVLYRLGHHDRIPRLFAHFEENRNFYLVQEFVPGASLRNQILPGQPWPEARVIVLIHDMLQVLAYVHDQNVIHRDIKPSNLICRKTDGRIVLIDFGAVKQVSLRAAMDDRQTIMSEPSVTISIGTLGYMPIEQANGTPQFNSDLYAVGMIGIEALTGMRSRDLQRDRQTGELIWRGEKFEGKAISIGPELGEILDGMVRSHFKERYQTVQEVLQAIDALLSQYSHINLETEFAALAADSVAALSELPVDSNAGASDELELPAPTVQPSTDASIGPTALLITEPIAAPIADLTSDPTSDAVPAIDAVDETTAATPPPTILESVPLPELPTRLSRFTTFATQKLVALQDSSRTLLQRCSTLLSRNVTETAQPRSNVRYLWIGIGGMVIAIGVITNLMPKQVRSPAQQSPLLSSSCREPSPPALPSTPPDLVYPNGIQYYGSLKNGLPADGRGIMVFPSGNRYDGEFKSGKRDGCGTYTFARGRRYVGQFQDDVFQGQGVWLLENGDYYVGMFRANRCDGEGTFTFRNGETRQGIWRDGQLEGTDLSCDR